MQLSFIVIQVFGRADSFQVAHFSRWRTRVGACRSAPAPTERDVSAEIEGVLRAIRRSAPPIVRPTNALALRDRNRVMIPSLLQNAFSVAFVSPSVYGKEFHSPVD